MFNISVNVQEFSPIAALCTNQ